MPASLWIIFRLEMEKRVSDFIFYVCFLKDEKADGKNLPKPEWSVPGGSISAANPITRYHAPTLVGKAAARCPQG
jgi:hypothetical protein